MYVSTVDTHTCTRTHTHTYIHTHTGSSHDQTPGLPKNTDPNQATFGTTTLRQESAGSIVSPPKSMADIERESEQGRELYKQSHNAWGVGELVDRNYDWSTFTKGSLYGVPTPHDNSGSQVRNALHWLHEAQRYVCASPRFCFFSKS